MSQLEEFPRAKLKAAERLLAVWRLHSCKHIRDLVKVDPDDMASKARAAVTKVKHANILCFDPYIASGYAPSENQMSNALEIILDPNGVHGLGLLGLRALLDAVDKTDEAITSKVSAIKAGLDHHSHVRLSREFSVENGRVDIRIDIRTAIGEKFLVFVENKRVRDALELGELPQTVRYERILRKEQQSGAIGLGIYLTPDAKQAESTFFAPVSCQRLAECLRARIPDGGLIIGEVNSTLVLLYAFTLTYDWVN